MTLKATYCCFFLCSKGQTLLCALAPLMVLHIHAKVTEVLPSCGVLLWLWTIGEELRPGLVFGAWLVSPSSISALHASDITPCLGTVKGPAQWHWLRRNGNESIKFHGNHFEGPTSGLRGLGSCGPELGCLVSFEWRAANFSS